MRLHARLPRPRDLGQCGEKPFVASGDILCRSRMESAKAGLDSSETEALNTNVLPLVMTTPARSRVARPATVLALLENAGLHGRCLPRCVLQSGLPCGAA